MRYDNYLYGGDKMKVFISWSGDISFKVAKILKDWIPCVIQGIEPYFSSDDIDKGARWSTDIAKELEEASFGILCVTRENLTSQWLNFEAGALSKAIDKSLVCPFLFDLKPAELSGSPILQFQMTNVDRDDMLKLFQSMNKSLTTNKLEDSVLEKSFTAFWPQIDAAFKEIEPKKSENNTSNKKANQEIMLEEMLDLLRSQQIMLHSPEKLIPQDYMLSIMQYEKENSNDFIMKYMREIIPVEQRREYARLSRMILDMTKMTAEEGVNSSEFIDGLMEYYNVTKRIMKRVGLYPIGFPAHKARTDNMSKY
jgi:hypothetical protein